MALTVTQPFAGHEIGDVITHDEEIKAILGSESARFVVQTPNPAPQAPAVSPTSE